MKKTLGIGTLALGAALVLTPSVASARDHDDWKHEEHERREQIQHERHEARERAREMQRYNNRYYNGYYNNGYYHAPYNNGYYRNGASSYTYDRWGRVTGFYDRFGAWHRY
jgi:hypothetical protein